MVNLLDCDRLTRLFYEFDNRLKASWAIGFYRSDLDWDAIAVCGIDRDRLIIAHKSIECDRLGLVDRE